MKVKLKISLYNQPAGSVIDLDPGLAETLLFCGRAEKPKPKGRPKKCATK